MKNLREADDSLKRFIQEDVKTLTDELSETDTLLQKIEDSRQSQMYAIRDIEEIKERLLSFGKYAENAAPDVLVTLIQTFVEHIYITDENDERHCHIFIKGCSKEDYDDFFRATGYIENTQETGGVTSVLPVCDSEECCKCIKLFHIYQKTVDNLILCGYNYSGSVIILYLYGVFYDVQKIHFRCTCNSDAGCGTLSERMR